MATQKFIPVQKTKTITNKETGKTETVKMDLYKGTSMKEAIEFLKQYGTDEERREFKRNCHLETKKKGSGVFYQKGKHKGQEIMEKAVDENGNDILVKSEKVNWLYAKQKFFEKFAPEFLPEKKEPKEKVSSLMDDWD